MKPSVTISPASPGHNLRATASRRVSGCAIPVFLALLSGCATFRSAPDPIPALELANAEPSALVPLVRGRCRADDPMPPRLLRELSEEFSLITIANPDDWTEVRRCLGLPPSHAPMDFSRGIIVGIQARVGQRAETGWPIHLQSIRRSGDIGRIDAGFAPGIYYPIKTAPYVELAYVPGVRKIGIVCIDYRTFLVYPTTRPE